MARARRRPVGVRVRSTARRSFASGRRSTSPASANVEASLVTTGAVTMSRRATSACAWGPIVSTMRRTLYCW